MPTRFLVGRRWPLMMYATEGQSWSCGGGSEGGTVGDPEDWTLRLDYGEFFAFSSHRSLSDDSLPFSAERARSPRWGIHGGELLLPLSRIAPVAPRG